MSDFVIRTDGKTGELLVDGKRVELVNVAVNVDVHQDVVRLDPSLPLVGGLSSAEMTLRLTLKPSDALMLMRGMRAEDESGQTADGESEA